jgi:hypothetical protein
VDGQTITEADLKSRIDNFEQYVNGGSVAGDLAHGEWVKKHHIFRPDFFGGSNDRGEFCTGTVSYRLHSPDKVGAEVFHQEARGSGDSNNWQPVNGLNVTVKAYRPMKLVYTASWLAWETGSALNLITSAFQSKLERMNDSGFIVANFSLFVQKLEQDASSLTRFYGTNRRLYASSYLGYDQVNGALNGSGGEYNSYSKSSGKQMSTHQIIDLSVGVYNVGIRVQAVKGSGDDGQYSQNIFVRPRSCVVDGHFTTST